ncbi:MAG TPA: PaaI family thioesterase [Armatimonadota bacterium]|mgnify:CR=1 FL=1|nr:PaaI family thioesterase [Armatimonadota bacterium]
MHTVGDRLHVEEHAGCVVCGAENAAGLQITYTTEAAGSVSALWRPGTRYEGFKGLVHGGMLATVLDEAMAKAVVSLGLEALTGDLRVRFRQYVVPDEPLRITGWVVSHRGRLLKAEATVCTLAGGERCHAWGVFAIVPGAPTTAQTAEAAW